MLQLERDRFLDRFKDKATWKRVKTMLNTNKPLREDRPDPAPTPAEIRSEIKKTSLPRRQVTGEPLVGDDASKLKAMADMTREFYKMNDAKTSWQTMRQAPKTVNAARNVFKMF